MAIACGGVRIHPTQERFDTALDISYTVTVTEGSYCTTLHDYDPSIPGSSIVEVRRASEEVPTTLAFRRPLVFERFPRRVTREPNPFGGPDSVPASVGDPIHEVPKGTYRLLLRYRTGHCAGRSYDRVCVAISSPFDLQSSVRFSREQ
jgi:hypothetical protein